MKNLQGNKLSMYLVVRDYMKANAEVLNPLPNFATNQAIFENAIMQIQASGEEQNYNKTGIAGGKHLLRQTLITLAADTSRKLSAYAKFNNDQKLLKEIKYNESSLRRRADINLRDAVMGLYDRVQPIVNLLGDYGITEATQTNLLNAIDAYSAAMPKTRLAIAEKKQSTAHLTALFQTAETALKNIDTAVGIVRLSQVDFYNGYKSARKVVSAGRSSYSVKGVVIDASTGEPLKAATIKFVTNMAHAKAKSINRNGEIIKKSAEKGGFILKSLAEGTYQVVVSKPGYKDETTTLHVSNGEISMMNIQLQHE